MHGFMLMACLLLLVAARLKVTVVTGSRVVFVARTRGNNAFNLASQTAAVGSAPTPLCLQEARYLKKKGT